MASFEPAFKFLPTGDVEIWLTDSNDNAVSVVKVMADRMLSPHPEQSFIQALQQGFWDASTLAETVNPYKYLGESDDFAPCSECGEPAASSDYLCKKCRANAV